MKLIKKKNVGKHNATLKNTTKMVKLCKQLLARSYSFADIMTRGKYVAFKLVSCSRRGNFLYKASKIHSDICNTCVDIVRQKMSTILANTQNRENDG